MDFANSSLSCAVQRAVDQVSQVAFNVDTETSRSITLLLASYVDKFRVVRCPCNGAYLAALALQLLRPKLIAVDFIKTATAEEILLLSYVAAHRETSHMVTGLREEMEMQGAGSMEVLLDLVQYNENPLKDLCDVAVRW